jgi:hypothetical protein
LRLFTTNYFLPDQDLESLLEEEVVVAGAGVAGFESDLEVSEVELLSVLEPSEDPLLSEEDLGALAFPFPFA